MILFIGGEKMTKKWSNAIKIFLIIVVSMTIGLIIGIKVFESCFVVCEYGDSIISYSIKFGQIQSCSSNFQGDGTEDPFEHTVKINLDGIHNNKDAVEQIQKQISDLGGRVISVLQ